MSAIPPRPGPQRERTAHEHDFHQPQVPRPLPQRERNSRPSAATVAMVLAGLLVIVLIVLL